MLNRDWDSEEAARLPSSAKWVPDERLIARKSRPVSVGFEVKKEPSPSTAERDCDTSAIALADDSDSLSYLGSFCYKKTRTYHARERDCYTSQLIANVVSQASRGCSTRYPGSHSSGTKKSRANATRCQVTRPSDV